MRAVIVALAVLVSLVPLWPVYQSPAFFVAVLGGAGLGGLIAWISALRRWSVLRTTLVAVAAVLIFGVPLAVPSATLFGVVPTLPGLLTLLSGVVLSWKQLVTIMPPVGAYEALLVPAFLLSLVGVLLAVSLSTRISKRSGWSSIAALVPVLTLGVSIWLGTGRGFVTILISAVVFILIALWFASAKRGIARSGLRAIGIVTVATVVSSALLIVVPITDRSVWRNSIEQPFVLQDGTSPLSEYRSYVTGEYSTVDLLTVTGLSAGNRVSLATLDNYTGVNYTVGGTAADFTRLPGSVSTVGVEGDSVKAEFQIEGLVGPWLPLPGALGSLSFAGQNAQALTDHFYYSRPAATGALTQAFNAGDTYRSTAISAPLVSLSQLADLAPGSATLPAPTVIPDGLDAFVALAAKGETTPGGRLQASLDALASEGYVSHGGSDEVPSASGHGANRIAALFATVPMVGDAEQYATAAALIATQTGFPARVVMGFLIPDGTGSDAPVTLTGAQMTAWVEISTQQGWVAINPNPEVRPIPEQQPDDPTEVAFPQTAVEPPAQEEPQLNDNTVPEAAEEQQTTPSDPVLQTVLAIVSGVAWLLLVLGIAISPLLGIIALKRRRRFQRHSAEDTRAQVEGAWSELRDVMTDHGLASTSSATRREIAEQVGLSAATTVAVLGDKAQYSSDPVSELDVERAWADVESVELELGAGISRWQRFQALISLKSFGWSWARFTRWLGSRR